MPRASRDGVSIYSERDGASGTDEADGSIGQFDGPDTVVFVQGLGYGRWVWRWQREALRGAYDVCAPDNRGTGRSEDGLNPVVKQLPGRLRRPRIDRFAGYSIEGMAADLEAVLEHAGVRRAHLVGVSMGGMIATAHAIEYDRATSLTLCSTSHGGPDAVPIPAETRERITATPKGATKREILRHRMRPAFTDRFTNRNPHLMDRIIEWRLEQDADEPVREAQAAAVLAFDASDRLDRVRVPTLVIHGSDDRVLPVANGRLLAEKLPSSRYVEIEGGSHLVCIEAAARVSAELGAFLEEVA